MPLNENAAVVPAGGYLFHGPVGTAAPEANYETADLETEPAFPDWVNSGFTSLSDLPSFGSDGGDTSTLGSWQRKVMRIVQTEAVTDYLTFYAYQFDRTVLEMYWGQQGGGAAGRFDIYESGARPLERAFLMIVTDGTVRIGFHAPKVSFSRDDSLELDRENFAQWPIRATFLKYQDQPLASWLGSEIEAPAGTVAPAEFASV